MRRSVLVAAMLLASVVAGGRLASQVGVYRAPADTVYLTTYNPHRQYWVRGVDTLGDMVPSLTVTAQRWRPDGAGFVVTTRQMDLDLTRRVRIDTLHVDALGRVSIPAGPAAAHAVDFTVHFPPGAKQLRPGFSWSDTTSGTETGSSGPPAPRHDFHVERNLRVTRAFDTLDTHVVEIASEGTVHYADSWWIDSAANSYAWMEVRGPTHEMYWFDPAAGRLVARRWQMSLTGLGGRPTLSGTDTTPAGLIASESERVIPAAIGRTLVRTLPGADTTYTFQLRDGKVIGVFFVQTERFDTIGRSTVESGFARPEGLVATVRTTYDRGRVLTYDAMWTDSTARLVRHHLASNDSTIVIHEDRALDTLPLPRIDSVMAAPSVAWAVADYAMEELIVPVLLALPHDTALHPVAIFRPTPRHWDTVQVRLRPIGSGPGRPLLVTIVAEGKPAPGFMIIGADGVLLYCEDTWATGVRRAPGGHSGRNGELQALIAAVRRR